MATTDYLQKFRETQFYRDIIAVDALFNAIIHACQTFEKVRAWDVKFIDVDWLDYRLGLCVFDLAQREHSTMEWMKLNYGVITANCVHAITPLHSSDRPTLIRLVRRLRNAANHDSRDLSSVVRMILTSGSFLVLTRVTGISWSARYHDPHQRLETFEA